MKRQETLTHKKIIQAALAILDQKGEKGLTMRRLATALDVKAASIYHHIPNKDILIQKIVDYLIEKVFISSEKPENLTEAIYAFSMTYREILRRHPGAVPLVATNPVSVDKGAELVKPLLSVIKKEITEEQALQMIQSIAVFINGHALAEVGNWPEPPTASQSYYNQWFETGITALIIGFKKQYKIDKENR